MGDLVQTLPALTDAARAIPGIRFDWVVDESFAQVPAWHKSVETVLPTALRRWQRDLRGTWRRGEVGAFLKRLRSCRYDLIVDVQGGLKSALLARLAHGPRSGYDRRGVHDWGAQLAYGRRHRVAKGQHSISRMRQLLAHALDYTYDETALDYGIQPQRLGAPPVAIPAPYLVFIHSTSWTSKVWPAAYWQELSRAAVNAGYTVVLPWGDEAERQRAHLIAGDDARAVVLPPLSIGGKASIIARAHATVGLDTGLSHIAAALDIPSVTIYGATDPALVGATGRNQRHLASAFACVKCHEVKCTYGGAAQHEPACLVEITPARVWTELQQLMNEQRANVKVQVG